MEFSEDWQPISLEEVRSSYGEPPETFHAATALLLKLLPACLGGAIIGIVIVVDQLPNPAEVSYIIVGFLLTVLGICGLGWINRMAAFRLLVYPDALVIRKGGHISVIRWDSMTSIWDTQDEEGTVVFAYRPGRSIRIGSHAINNVRNLKGLLRREALQRKILWRHRNGQAAHLGDHYHPLSIRAPGSSRP